MAGLTATFRAPRREFWLFDDLAGLCHCGEVRRRLCLSVQGVLVIFFGTFLSDSLLGAWVWRASVWLPWRGCAEWLRRGTLRQTFLLVENFRLSGENEGPCIEERCLPIIFGFASSWKTCRVAKMFSLAFDSRRGLPSKKNYFFSMLQRKAHLECKCSWHMHTETLVTHAAPSRSQTSRGTLPEAGTMTKKLLRIHASLSLFIFFQTSRCWKTLSSRSCMLLDFVGRSPARTRSWFSWQRWFDVILRGREGAIPSVAIFLNVLCITAVVRGGGGVGWVSWEPGTPEFFQRWSPWMQGTPWKRVSIGCRAMTDWCRREFWVWALIWLTIATVDFCTNDTEGERERGRERERETIVTIDFRDHFTLMKTENLIWHAIQTLSWGCSVERRASREM